MHRKTICLTLLVTLLLQVFALAYTTLPYTPLTPLELEYQKAYAQAQEIIPVTNIPERIQRGEIHETWNLNNAQGEFRTVLGVPTWTFDSASGQYVPIKVIDNRSTTNELIIQSGLISVKFLNDEVYFYDANFTKFSNPVSETWLLKNGVLEVPKTFQSLSFMQSGNNANITKSYNTPVGTYILKYVIREGQPLKHEVTLQANVTGSYTTVQQWSLQIDKYIKRDGSEVNLSGLPDGSIPVSKALVGDSLKFLRFEKSGLPVIFESLESGWDNFILLSITKSGSNFTLGFNYGTWTDNIFLDPDTFTTTTLDTDPNGFADGNVSDNNNNDLCDTGDSKDTGGIRTELFVTAGAADCSRAWMEWTITSIPDGADVTDTVFKFDVQVITSPLNCDYMEVNNQPTTTAAGTLFTDLGDGTVFVDNNSICTTTGDNKSLDLGTAADSDVEAQLTSNWWGLGVKFDSETVGTARLSRICDRNADGAGACTPFTTLEVTYTPPAISINIVLNPSSSNTFPEGITSFSLSGCSVSPTTHDGNPASQSFSVLQNCTLTIAPAVSGTHRWDFREDKASITINTGSTPSASFTRVYYETFTLTYNDSGLPDAIGNSTLAYTAPPTTEGSSDSPQSKNVTLTSTPTNYDAKEDASWTVAAQLFTVSSTERYITYNTLTATVSGALTTVFNYQHEFNISSSSSLVFKTLTGNFTLRNAPTPYFVTMNNGTVFNLLAITYPAWLGQTDPNTNSFLNMTWNTISKVSPSTATFTIDRLTPLITTPVSVDTSNRQQWAIDGNTTITNIAYDSSQTQFTWNAQGNGIRVLKVDQVDSTFQKEPTFITINGTRSFDTSSNWSYDSTNKIFTFNNIAFSDNNFTLSYAGGVVSASIFNEFNNTAPFPNEYRLEVVGPTNITRQDCSNCSSFDVTVPSDVDSVRIWYRPNRTEAYYRWQVEEIPTQGGHQFDFFFANHTEHTLSQYTFTLTDQTGAFGNGTIIRFLKQRDNAAGQITIDEQRIDIEPKSLVYLVRDERYFVQVDNGASVVQVGNFTASSDLDIPMTVNGLLLSNTVRTRHDAIQFDSIHNGTLITTSYLDSTAGTLTSSARVFNNTNSSICTFSSNATTSWQFNCTPVDQFGNYFVQLNVTHSRVTDLNWDFSETIPAHKRGTVLPALNLGLPTSFQTFFGFPIALLGVAFIAMLWAPGKQGFGGIVTSLAAGFFWYAGLFPEAISFTLIASILLFATLHHFTTRRRIPY